MPNPAVDNLDSRDNVLQFIQPGAIYRPSIIFLATQKWPIPGSRPTYPFNYADSRKRDALAFAAAVIYYPIRAYNAIWRWRILLDRNQQKSAENSGKQRKAAENDKLQ